ncbi:MAG: DUF4256 domain-containing protein [Saprospiraceae bacterium]
MTKQDSRSLTPEQQMDILNILKLRFEKNTSRHEGILWSDVQKKLEGNPEKLGSLSIMEETGGEPDVVAYDDETKEFVFFDCSPESPKERRSLCFDREAWESRKEYKPKDNAMDVAASMGVEMLTEAQFYFLQTLGKFDQKTSSWVKTPEDVRKLGGALFCDYRFGRVFTYHNGAESYYGARGFRSCLHV